MMEIVVTDITTQVEVDAGYELFEVVVTASDVLVINGGGGSVAWGSIGGTLSNQTDLQLVLNQIESDQTVQDNAIALNTAKRSYPIEDETRLANTSGTNTGDQDISGIATNASDIDAIELEQITQNDAIALNTAKRSYPLTDELRLANTSGVNTGDQDLTPYLTIASASATYEPLRGIDENYVTDAQLVVIENTSGVNTGDQDISGIATNASAISDINLLLPQFTTEERESNTCLFDKNYIIGNTAAITGNILFDFTDAKLGATSFMYHDNSGAYSFPIQGVIYDFKPADLTSVVGNILFAFTITDIALGAEVVQIRVSLTESQLP